MKMRVILPDYVVDEADGKHYDSDWNDLDTTGFPLPLSLCILVGITFKQTESNCQHLICQIIITNLRNGSGRMKENTQGNTKARKKTEVLLYGSILATESEICYCCYC